MDGSGATGGTWPAAVAGPAVVLASCGIAWVVARLGVAMALRRGRGSAGAAWSERARLSYPARRVIALDSGLVPLGLGGIVGFRVAPALGLAATTWGVLAGLAGFVAVLAVGQGLERRLCRPTDPGVARGPGISMAWLLLPPVLVPFALMLALMPGRWGWDAAAVLTLGAALATFHVGGGWLLVLRRLGLARPASPRLAAIVGRVVDRVGVRPRASFELASPQANAMAWPVPRLLVFIGPIAEILDDDELASIVAHELGHLDEPWSSYLTRLASSYFLVAFAACLPLGGSFGPMAGLAPPALLVATLWIARRVGRRMEERSDRLGRENQGEAGGTYARALEALYRANLVPAVLRGKRNVHPDLHDRLIAAGVTPDYPRPAPPPRVGLAGLPAILLVMAGSWALVTGIDAGRREAYALSIRAGELTGRAERGDLERAAGLYRRAAALDPGTPDHAANLAALLVYLGHSDQAEAAVRLAEQAPRGRPDRDHRIEALLAQIRADLHRVRHAAPPPPDPAMRED